MQVLAQILVEGVGNFFHLYNLTIIQLPSVMAEQVTHAFDSFWELKCACKKRPQYPKYMVILSQNVIRSFTYALLV